MRASTWLHPVLACVAFAGLAAPPAAAALRWAGAEVQARTVDGCFVLTESILRRAGFNDVQVSPSEITGRRGQAYLAVTCVATRPRPTAIVMAVGDDDPQVARARDEIAQLLRADRGDPREPL